MCISLEIIYYETASAKSSGGGLKQKILAGSVTGAFEAFLSYPAEYVKTQLQLDEKIKTTRKGKFYDGVIDCVKKTVNEKRIRGLYAGLNSVLYGSFLRYGVRFVSFDTFEKRAANELGYLSPHKRAVCALGAGICEAVIAVTPVESIKTKFISDQRSENKRFKSFSQGVGLIVKEQGIRGLYQGLTPTMLKHGTSLMLRFYTLDMSMHFYQSGDPETVVPPLYTFTFLSLSGTVSVLCNNPFDVIQSRMQSLDATKYKSTIDCMMKILENEGVTTFFSGLIPRVFRVALVSAMSLTIYDYVLDLIQKGFYIDF